MNIRRMAGFSTISSRRMSFSWWRTKMFPPPRLEVVFRQGGEFRPKHCDGLLGLFPDDGRDDDPPEAFVDELPADHRAHESPAAQHEYGSVLNVHLTSPGPGVRTAVPAGAGPLFQFQ